MSHLGIFIGFANNILGFSIWSFSMYTENVNRFNRIKTYKNVSWQVI